jgi:hypothetical protein
MKLSDLLIKISRLFLLVSLFFLIPGLFIAGLHPHEAKDISGIAYMLLVLSWILDIISLRRN